MVDPIGNPARQSRVAGNVDQGRGVEQGREGGRHGAQLAAQACGRRRWVDGGGGGAAQAARPGKAARRTHEERASTGRVWVPVRLAGEPRRRAVAWLPICKVQGLEMKRSCMPGAPAGRPRDAYTSSFGTRRERETRTGGTDTLPSAATPHRPLHLPSLTIAIETRLRSLQVCRSRSGSPPASDLASALDSAHISRSAMDTDVDYGQSSAGYSAGPSAASARSRPARTALRSLVLHEFGHKQGLEVHVSGFKWLASAFAAMDILEDVSEMRIQLALLAERIVQDRSERQPTATQSFASSQSQAAQQLVTGDTLSQAYDALQAAAQRSQVAGAARGAFEAETDLDANVRVVSSFALPRYAFDVRRRTFVRPSGGAPSLLARAVSRPGSLRERLEVTRAIVQRNEHFQAPLALGASADQGQAGNFLQLSSTTDLAGRAAPVSSVDGAGARRFLLLGLLTTLPDGRAAVEDLDGVVPLDLARATAGEGLFTHGAIVLLEGFARALPRSTGTAGVGSAGVSFVATALSHPPAERRSQSLALYGHIDFLGTGVLGSAERARLQAQEQAAMAAATARGEDPDAAGAFMVTLSDVHLDSERDLAKLAAVFTGFEQSAFIPRIIVLCGHFCADTVGGDRVGRYKGTSLNRSHGSSLGSLEREFSS